MARSGNGALPRYRPQKRRHRRISGFLLRLALTRTGLPLLAAIKAPWRPRLTALYGDGAGLWTGPPMAPRRAALSLSHEDGWRSPDSGGRFRSASTGML